MATLAHDDVASTTVVYRAGPPVKIAPDGVVGDQWRIADERRPDGHVGRCDGIFCAPLAAQAVCWSGVGSADRVTPWSVFALELVPGVVPFVYDADAWLSVDWPYRLWADAEARHAPAVVIADARTQLNAAIDRYWQSAVPLCDLADVRAEWCDPSRAQAEMLIEPRWIVAGRWFTTGRRPRRGRRLRAAGLARAALAHTATPPR